MADDVLLTGPVTVANLIAEPGVTSTIDGWWPCLDITWLTPVPPSITKITAQVRERGLDAGKNPPIAETVMTDDDMAAGSAKVVNGVALGQHLEVRLNPAGAPGLPFQPTPWVEATTPLTLGFEGAGFPLAYYYLGGPPDADQELFRFRFPVAVSFAADFAGAQGSVETNPASSFVETVNKNGSAVGTITTNTSGVSTFASSGGSAYSFAAGDVLTVTGPNPADAAVTGIARTFLGTLL